MRLGELIRGLEVLEVHGDLGVEIADISSDSRLIKGGELFVAIRGERADGHNFLQEAISRGARALLVEDPPSGIGVPWVRVGDTRVALGEVASRFYGRPSLGLKVVGITGTNGKTTSCYILESILKAYGAKVGVIGTVSYRWMDQQREAQNTTPSSLELQRLLKEMLDSGVSYVVMEVSSHALVQRRLKGCHFDVGIFTNISPEHLDYHGTMQEYLRAKALFFQEVLKESQKDPWAIYNADDPKVREVVEGVEGLKGLGFGMGGLVRPLGWRADPQGISFKLETPKGLLEARSKLIGYHNLYNIMAAVSAAIILDVPTEAICQGIEGLRGVPGRLERVSERPKVFVDYAHTPDALKKALEALRPLARGKLIVVFGCGGERDRSKRPLMGKIASLMASLTVITSDNPRGEDPMAIIGEIRAGIQPGAPYLVIPDRREAIREAIRRAEEEDVVLIAGKGHEAYQIIGSERYPFDDRQEARKALEEFGWI